MRLIRTLPRVICITLSALMTLAASGVDWKLYGSAQVDGHNDWCFYESGGIVRQGDGLLRVWTKCLEQKDMDAIDVAKDFHGQILEKAARQIASYYVPPIGLTEDLNAEQAMQVTLYEETADISNIEPTARIFYELNCQQRMMRELSIQIRRSDALRSINKPGDWRYIPPEGNGARLLRIVCILS